MERVVPELWLTGTPLPPVTVDSERKQLGGRGGPAVRERLLVRSSCFILFCLWNESSFAGVQMWSGDLQRRRITAGLSRTDPNGTKRDETSELAGFKSLFLPELPDFGWNSVFLQLKDRQERGGGHLSQVWLFHLHCNGGADDAS